MRFSSPAYVAKLHRKILGGKLRRAATGESLAPGSHGWERCDVDIRDTRRQRDPRRKRSQHDRRDLWQQRQVLEWIEEAGPDRAFLAGFAELRETAEMQTASLVATRHPPQR